MKVCTTTHTHPTFGEIPAGSLWADDSEYVDDEHFAAVADTAKPVKAKPVRKFGQKEASDGDSGMD